jgi:hypothetical protein
MGALQPKLFPLYRTKLVLGTELRGPLSLSRAPRGGASFQIMLREKGKIPGFCLLEMAQGGKKEYGMV